MLRVDGNQPAIRGANVYLAVPDGDAPVVARGVGVAETEVEAQLGNEPPQQFPRGRVQGEHVVQAAGHVDHAVNYQGLRRERERRNLRAPGEAEILHVGVVDLVERAVMLAGETATVHQPVFAGIDLIQNPRLRHVTGRFRGDFRFSRQPGLERQKNGRNADQQRSKPHMQPLPRDNSTIPQSSQRFSFPALDRTHRSRMPPPKVGRTKWPLHHRGAANMRQRQING